MRRRRFLTLSAAALAMPARAEPVRWRGMAMGAEVSLTIRAPREQAEAAIAAARAELRRMERLFSLYDPASDLVRLNGEGVLRAPDPRFVGLCREAGVVHAATGGLFDPTVQPLWAAHAGGGDLAAARDAVGWDRVAVSDEAVALAPGQAVTFNGIAQGAATDAVTATLTAHDLGDVLVQIGEFAATGGPWRLGVADPSRGLVATRTLRRGAMATSSPGAMRLGPVGHILHPDRMPVWSTVSVEAGSAARADAASTALCLAGEAEARGIATALGLRWGLLVREEGGAVTI